jgi:hypothetical protein
MGALAASGRSRMAAELQKAVLIERPPYRRIRVAQANDAAVAKITSAEAGFLRNDTGDAPLSIEISKPWPIQ